LDYKGGGLDAARFQGILDSVQASYLDLFSLRDIAAAELKIDLLPKTAGDVVEKCIKIFVMAVADGPNGQLFGVN
jgi:hypothetical protein